MKMANFGGTGVGNGQPPPLKVDIRLRANVGNLTTFHPSDTADQCEDDLT